MREITSLRQREKQLSAKCRAIIGMSCSLCCTGLWLGILIVTLLLLYGSTQDATRECHGRFGPVEYLHRGNLTHAQENTIESVVEGGAALGANVAVQVRITSDEVAILHNDESFWRMTGVSASTDSLVASDAQRLTVRETIDGYDYGTTSRVPTLGDVLNRLCPSYLELSITLEVSSHEAARAAVNTVQWSRCLWKDQAIFATRLPTVGNTLTTELRKRDMQNHVAIILHPGEFGGLGLYFFLRTGLFTFSSGASMLLVHRVVWEKEEEDIRRYEEFGYCTGIFGLRREEMLKYPGTSTYIIDEAPYFPNTPDGQPGGDGGTEAVRYDGSRAGYYTMMTLGILCFPLLIASTGCLYVFIRRVQKTRHEGF